MGKHSNRGKHGVVEDFVLGSTASGDRTYIGVIRGRDFAWYPNRPSWEGNEPGHWTRTEHSGESDGTDGSAYDGLRDA